MTREEAKEYLIHISYDLGTVGVEYLSTRDGEKMRNAIEALSAEPCEDCISRQEAIDTIGALYLDGDSSMSYRADAETGDTLIGKFQAITELSDLPPVTLQQKMGRWIHFAWSDDCSECGWSTGKYESPTNYCPNCGAKMEVSND